MLKRKGSDTRETIETLTTKIPSKPELPSQLKDFLASSNINANKVEIPHMLKITLDGTIDAKNTTIPDESFSIDPNGSNDRSSLFEYSAPANIVRTKTLGLFLEHCFSSLHLFISMSFFLSMAQYLNSPMLEQASNTIVNEIGSSMA